MPSQHGHDPAAREALIALHSRVKPQRAQNIFAQSIEVIEGYTPPFYEKSDEVIKFIDSSLADNFIFTSLSDVERGLLINAMQPEIVKAGSAIINQGDVGDYFYVVADGQIHFVVNGVNVGSATRGASFGELALLYDSPRAATCIANSDCQLWKVDQKTFRYMLANNTATNQRGIMHVLKKVEFFDGLDAAALNKVADALTSIVFQDGEKIINKGDVGEVFYIVREGCAKATQIGLGDSSFVDQEYTVGMWFGERALLTGEPRAAISLLSGKSPAFVSAVKLSRKFLGRFRFVDQEYTAGMTFGERALLTGEPRAANITAIGEVSCLCLSRETFEKVLGPLQSLMDKAMTNRILMGIPIFANSKFERFEMDQLNDLVEDLTFAKDTEVVNKGDAVHQALYIIRKGQVTVSNPNGIINTLKTGDHFGGKTLVDTQGTSTETIVVTEDAIVGILTKSSIEAVIGDLSRLGKPIAAKTQSLDSSILFNDLVKYRILGVGTFGKVWLVSHKKTGKPFALKMLSKHEIIGHKQVEGVIREKKRFEMDQLNDLVEDLNFPKDTVVITKGEQVHQALYIIKKGQVTVSNPNGLINTLRPGDHFGGQTLVDTLGTSTETISVIEDAVVGVLTRGAIEAVIGNLGRLGKPIAAKASKLDRSILFNDLVKFRILGVGTFGKVWLVSHKKTGKPFALKMLSKHEIIGHKQVEGVIREKNILSSVNHPFVVNLVTTFMDDKSLFMVIEYVQGGELFSVIHTERRDGVPFDHARFYSACILESLAHLHDRHICYRDLKPENVLVDGGGYCVLVDLGFAKIVRDKTYTLCGTPEYLAPEIILSKGHDKGVDYWAFGGDKTYTLCGTPEYLAPEIILSKGHDKGVDYWAFGVLIYELLVGQSPFYSYGSDQVSLFKRIVQAKHSFPSGGVVNDISQDMIQRLIVRRQTNRLGCLARAENDVRDHKFFSGINYDSLMAKKIVAPWVPSLSDPLDASHFDSYEHIEMETEPIRNPLTPKQQAVFEGF
eukprot:CAMPEP_0194346156 /NCGR_PEP_ID=MMETSP0171-20130528/105264_1 /TAXON_ID=218684 /ORGANISM="Corethron pennatum, Strain L29A3" /LENGTH=1009 /DNA_ID=CAMNT_0039113245 /DNA_START=182 /DNA_END=3211 /DNA_ORIENTATION=+